MLMKLVFKVILGVLAVLIAVVIILGVIGVIADTLDDRKSAKKAKLRSISLAKAIFNWYELEGKFPVQTFFITRYVMIYLKISSNVSKGYPGVTLQLMKLAT